MQFINIIKVTAIKANGVELMGYIRFPGGSNKSDFCDKMCIFCTRIAYSHSTFLLHIYIFNFNWKCMRLGKQNWECDIMLTLKAKKSMILLHHFLVVF